MPFRWINGSPSLDTIHFFACQIAVESAMSLFCEMAARMAPFGSCCANPLRIGPIFKTGKPNFSNRSVWVSFPESGGPTQMTARLRLPGLLMMIPFCSDPTLNACFATNDLHRFVFDFTVFSPIHFSGKNNYKGT